MKKKYLALAGRIRGELSELEKVVERVLEGWKRAKQTGDDFYLDSVALNLHSIYTGLERVFELIANTIDQSRPEGQNWHQELLRQMTVEIPLVRPQVISVETRNNLDDYRGFRHVVRNVYTFNLNSGKIKHLVNNLPKVFSQVKNEINVFIQFIEARKGENKEI
ncbi:hypothetical protein [Calderihabitans maritimus]|uniref:HepT-like domain-containing protein n=1 Tax=Calderihabitans maritimus TaxID=1246530 RepID=A0A1Z5HUS2_9FIRM|nr:hypothetical protein [Calderihabitans maritimus]GAW93081.1 hypothetical protein Tph_c19370 [Calderihabitans maritimus]